MFSPNLATVSLIGPQLASARTLPYTTLGNPFWDLAGATPSLDLRFAENKSLVDAVSGQNLVTFTRASSGTFIDSQGLIQTAAENVPRFTHDPVTGESLGLLVEEQRTNSIRNNTMQGAVVGTPGTLPTNWQKAENSSMAINIVGVGTENGVQYVDVRYVGTASGSTSSSIQFEQNSAIAAANGQTWTVSSFVKIQSGTRAGVSLLRIGWEERSGSFLAISQGTINPATSGSLASARFAFTATNGNASTTFIKPFINFTPVNGAAIDITLRIGLPQLEQGSFATSVIPTTVSAATRSAEPADVISAAIANGIRTLYLEFRSPASGTRGVVSLNDNTANERASVITSGTDPRLVVVDGGVEQANINGGTITANARTRVAVRINANDFAASINGGATVTDTSGTLPTVDRLMLGRTQAGEYLTGRLARVVGWRDPLPDLTLRTLSA